MIILKHLTVERFRLLRELNLHFPQRGSILIQGPNEAGKSSLLESIYFALYGEALATHGRRSLDDLISYGATSTAVTLALSIGTNDLTVTRTLERGKGQSIRLLIHRQDSSEKEIITSLEVANKRIITELGRLDAETFRSACLIEQKGLDRLERLSGVEREAVTRKLLGLEKLTRLTEQFQVTPEDERQLKECTDRFHLAEIQARIPALSQQLDQIEAALDAVKLCKELDTIHEQENEIAEQQKTLTQIKNKRPELKSRQGRILQLSRANTTLADIIAAYDGIAEARQQIPELEKQITELERREHEELPVLEKRVTDLAELTRSFGTLQRMSNDLLTAVDAIKELEQELKQHDEVRDDLKSIEDQVAYAQTRVEEAQQALKDLDALRREGRPQLEARLQRMRILHDRLRVMRQLEDQYVHHLASREQAEENSKQLNKVQKELDETENEMTLVEEEARQAQQQVEALEKRSRQLSIRRQMEEWVRLKGLAQGLAQAEQHVNLAYQHQEKIRQMLDEARGDVKKYGLFIGACAVIALISFILALFFGIVEHNVPLTLVLILIGLAAIGSAWLNWKNFSKVRQDEMANDQQMQEAINRVRMMVVARETAARVGGNNDTLIQIEQEIRSLGGTLPRSLEEGQAFLQQNPDQGESLANLQQLVKEKQAATNAARNQVNVTMEAVAALRKERARLEEQRKKENWDLLEENLASDQASVERMHQEITLLAGQEGLPMPILGIQLQDNGAFGMFSPVRSIQDSIEDDTPELDTLVEGTIKATERDMATLTGKLDLVTDLTNQVKVHQDALDVLLARQRVIEERNARYQTSNPALQVERAREQQMALRQALQSLQDSLRQRVKPLGVVFGQTAISNAETTARKQLEELQIQLGNKIMLQEKLSNYMTQRTVLQESLSEHYKQLAKFSNSLGSWIVPPKPFAEDLQALRARCQREIEDGNEAGIVKELEKLQDQEGATKLKIELCEQEITTIQERIATLLTQRNRPPTKAYTYADIAAVWPLLNDYTVADRARLEEERLQQEKELAQLEEKELKLSQQLQSGNAPLDLAQERLHMEKLERSYQTKKRGNQLATAVNERMMRKMVPRTEYYMQQILPLLTSGRYHDVHLTTEPEEGSISGGPLQISVWDGTAGEYVSKSALSGGAADQLSLALRLAFTLASLPRELEAAPAFVMMDEPLSSFDRTRTKALVDVFTGELLSQHFEQIVLISHNGAFDPAMFPYHVYMENGITVESNLPVVVPPINSNKLVDKDLTYLRLPIPIIPAKDKNSSY